MGDAHKSREELLADLERLRRRNELLRAESPTGFRMLLEQLPVMLWTTDTEFRCLSWSGGGLKQLGLDPDQLVGMSMYEYFGTEDPESPPILAHHRAILGGSSQYEFEFAGVAAWCHVEPLYDEDGEITGVIGVALDVSATARAEAECARALDELRAIQVGQSPLGEQVKICSGCKCIRETDGAWTSIERILAVRCGTRFSHGLCADCVRNAQS